MNETLQEVMQTVADVFSVSAEELSPESTPETVDGWDSLQQLNLVLALEEVYQIEFNPDDIGEMNSIGSIAALVARKTGRVDSSLILT